MDRQECCRKGGPFRSPLSEVTRLREIVNRNVTRIANNINSILVLVFPILCDILSIESKFGLMILEEHTLPSEISNLSLSDSLTTARINEN
jgi:hypothetical protein